MVCCPCVPQCPLEDKQCCWASTWQQKALMVHQGYTNMPCTWRVLPPPALQYPSFTLLTYPSTLVEVWRCRLSWQRGLGVSVSLSKGLSAGSSLRSSRRTCKTSALRHASPRPAVRSCSNTARNWCVHPRSQSILMIFTFISCKVICAQAPMVVRLDSLQFSYCS